MRFGAFADVTVYGGDFGVLLENRDLNEKKPPGRLHRRLRETEREMIRSDVKIRDLEG